MQTHARGFTLIELMIALTILSILMAVAVPSFREFTQNNRVTAAQTDLVTAFSLARSEALRRSRPVSVCASTDGGACAGAEDWASGWIVFTDGTGAAGAVDGADEVLQAWGAVGGDVTFDASGAFVQYQPTGTVLPAAVTLDVRADGCTGEKMRRVQVRLIGSLQATRESCPS